MKKLRIFYVDPQSGGNLALYDHGIFSNLGNLEVFYYCGKQYPYSERNNVKIKKIFNYRSKTSKLGKAFSYTFSMLRLLIGGFMKRPDVVHVQWLKLFWIDYIVYWILSKCLGAKIVFTAHNIVPHEANKTQEDQYSRWYKICDCVIVHTETSKLELVETMNYPSEKTVVIPHGCLDIPCDKDTLASLTKSFSEELGITSDKLVFGHLGYLSHYKGTDLLIDAWLHNQKLSEADNAILLIAGKEGEISLPSNLPDNVKLINRYLSDEEFKALLSITDVMVMPYRKIDQSGLLLTLLSEDIPFVVSKAGELSRVLSFSNVGWSLDNIEIETIAEKLIHVLDSKSEFESKKHSPEWSKLHELYDWSEISRKTAKLYVSVIEV